MINLKDPARMKALRKVGDPAAEAVVAKILESGESAHMRVVFDALRKNSDISQADFSALPGELQSVVRAYFDQGKQLPDFADKNKIKLGEQIFQRYGPEISLLLFCMALPLCYSCRKGAKVLVLTGRTLDPGHNINPLARRLLETAQFVIYALSPGGMDAGGLGISTTLKVRLIHASIRHYILHPKTNPGGWDQEEYGYPINQQDLAGTLSSFSALTLFGLQKMGIELSEEEKDAFMHCWKIVGHFNGLQPELLTDSYEDGWDLGLAILSDQAEASQDGKDLTAACLDFGNEVLPKGLFNGYLEALMYHFCDAVGKKAGKNMPEILGLDSRVSWITQVEMKGMEWFFRLLGKEEHRLPFLQMEVGKMNQAFLSELSSKYNQQKGIKFDIPPSLKGNWKLS